MRKVVTFRYCDFCYEETDQETKVTNTFTLGVSAGEEKPALYVAETCDVHAKPLQDLMAMLQILQPLSTVKPTAETAPARTTSTRTVTKSAPSKVGATHCQMCGKQLGATALPGHIWTAHVKEPRPPQPKVCPDCGIETKDGTGMGHHRRNKHGYSSIDEAYARATA